MSIPQTQPQTQLAAPAALCAAIAPPVRAAAQIRQARDAVRDILHGRDRERLLAVVGPCSIHDPEAALDYARRLARVARELEGELLVVMRTYLEKPRTTLGWKGLLRDPHLDDSGDLVSGLALGRRILAEVSALGVPCASELLDPLAVPYLEDLLSWAVIGARTAESQPHRELASGLAMAVGFKNGMRGELEVARDATVAARAASTYLGVDPDGQAVVVRTHGNPDGHLVLRGGTRPNYDATNVSRALGLLDGAAPARPLLIDCSHGNSGGDPTRQAIALRSVLDQVAAGERRLMGFMLESHLHPGRQDREPGLPLRYGVSITDGCIGWPETERLLCEAAATVRARRGV